MRISFLLASIPHRSLRELQWTEYHNPYAHSHKRVKAGTMIILRCRACKGTGEVTNEQYRICQALKSHAAKRYFHYPMEESAGDENEQQKHDACHGVPEKVDCPICEGVGEVSFEEDDWELRIVADEDEHLEE